MRRRRLVSAIVIVVALALLVGACGGDDEETTTSPATPPSQSALPPSDPGQLPPDFVECMADQGIDVESSPEAMHSPEAQQALQACLGTLHDGGGP